MNSYVQTKNISIWRKAKFYLLYFIYNLNHLFIKKIKLEKKLWDHIKLELFYVAGKCQHTGNCCRNLKILSKRKWINHIQVWEKIVQKDPKVYKRFIPHTLPDGSIKKFNCSCLTQNNTCSEYETRPHFCRSYPMSNFIMKEKIPKTCGYFVQLSQFQPTIKNTHLLNRMKQVIRKNDILKL